MSLTAWMWNNKPMRPLFSEPLTLLLPSIWYSDELYYIFHAPGSHISKTEAKELSKLPSYVYQNQFRQELSRWGHSTYNRAQAIWEKRAKGSAINPPTIPLQILGFSCHWEILITTWSRIEPGLKRHLLHLISYSSLPSVCPVAQPWFLAPKFSRQFWHSRQLHVHSPSEECIVAASSSFFVWALYACVLRGGYILAHRAAWDVIAYVPKCWAFWARYHVPKDLGEDFGFPSRWQLGFVR